MWDDLTRVRQYSAVPQLPYDIKYIWNNGFSYLAVVRRRSSALASKSVEQSWAGRSSASRGVQWRSAGCLETSGLAAGEGTVSK